MRRRTAADGRHKKETRETLGRVIFSNVFSLLKIFVICLLLVYGMMNFLVRPINIHGDSMLPTLKDGELAFSSAFSAKFLDIERGDIVIAYENTSQFSYIIKRVIGIPGDTVSCRDDIVYVNGEPLDEPYLENEVAEMVRDVGEPFTEDFEEVVLKEDEYWLMGDNRLVSLDSRKFGAFHRDQIKGVGIFVFFPFSKIKVVK